jgi:hypothetical protein
MRIEKNYFKYNNNGNKTSRNLVGNYLKNIKYLKKELKESELTS